MSLYTPTEVASFMESRLKQSTTLYQETIVREIAQKFGPEFVYRNKNGNPAIDKGVLKEFRRLSPNAIWERGSRSWRCRKPFDQAGSRMQD
jgi:hypothetical protein